MTLFQEENGSSAMSNAGTHTGTGKNIQEDEQAC